MTDSKSLNNQDRLHSPIPSSSSSGPRVFPITSQSAGVSAGSLKKSQRRFEDIDRVKAVAILLVVIGHIPDPQSPAWARVLRFDIYNFHMPLFMYLSGYVYFRAVNSPKNASFTRFFWDRANRLLVPFAAFAALVINMKFFGRSFADLRRADFDYLSGYKYLFVETTKNPAVDLWYLFVLFAFSVLSFNSMRRRPQLLKPLLGLAFVAYAIFAYYEPRGGMTDFLYADRMCWFYIFFVLGAIACNDRDATSRAFKRYWPIAMLIFALSEYLINQGSFAFLSGWRFLIIGACSIVFLHGLLYEALPRGNSILRVLADNALMIYLFNTMVIAALQQFIYRHHLLEGLPYALTMGGITVVAVAIPIALRALILRVEFCKPFRPYVS